MSPATEIIRDQLVALLPRLRRFARALSRNPHDADDLVQVAVERALLHLDQLKPAARLDSWMFGIVRNAWIDEVRARQRRNRVLAPEEEGEHVGGGTGESQAEALSIHEEVSVADYTARKAEFFQARRVPVTFFVTLAGLKVERRTYSPARHDCIGRPGSRVDHRTAAAVAAFRPYHHAQS